MKKVQRVRPVLAWRKRSTSKKYVAVDQLIDQALVRAQSRQEEKRRGPTHP